MWKLKIQDDIHGKCCFDTTKFNAATLQILKTTYYQCILVIKSLVNDNSISIKEKQITTQKDHKFRKSIQLSAEASTKLQILESGASVVGTYVCRAPVSAL